MSTKLIARDQCLAPERAGDSVYGGRYRRLFENLAPLDSADEALHALGGPGGICDDDADRSTDGEMAAGWPFFGQFIAHDITADRSPLGHRADPEQIQNFRTPRANLEGVYAAGPTGSPYLFQKDDPAKLLLGEGGHDVPRNFEGIALLGDQRNDTHLFMSQLQLAFIKTHNRFVDRLREDGMDEAEVFADARRATTWHYQWVILREFLPLLVGPELVSELLDGGTTLFEPGDDPYIPFEFADAAYRYGHSQVRDAYRVNKEIGPVPVFPDLMGFGAVPVDHAIDWSLQFDVPGQAPAQRCKKIDGKLPRSLIELPRQISGEDEGSAYSSLANRDLQRGQAVGLPSGEAVARELGVDPLTPDQTGLASAGWEQETPLWLYVLKEAEALEDGDRLGSVGGRLVGEVLVGIIDSDPESFRSVDPTWRPTLPSHEAGAFGIADLLVPSS
ncbi:MAG TPA: peroxidase family protein [Solirubrobacterales bacterium]